MVFCILPLVAGLALGVGEFDVVINEIHYHSFGNDPGDEFVELHNRGARAVDVSGWRLEGGLSLTLPRDLLLPGGGYLVLSPDPERTVRRYGVPRDLVVGAWAGQLDNDGDTLVLLDAAGRRIARTRYRDGNGWPAAPDGFGPTLELVSPRYDFDFPESWAASARPGGTPGARNSRYFADESTREALIRPGDVLRFLRGRSEPSPEPLAWTGETFDEGGWETGPGPVGYGVLNLGTPLADMQGGYTSVYLRAAFHLEREDLDALGAGTLSLLVTVRYDDGFAAYAGGAEAFRINMPGTFGSPIPFDAVASASDQSTVSFDLAGLGDRLREGRNVLALHGLNRDLSQSSDFLLEVSVERVRRSAAPAGAAPILALNEVSLGEPGGEAFIEVVNTGFLSVPLAGFRLTADPYDRDAGHVFPGGPSLQPGELRAVGASALGFAIPAQEARYLLLSPDGSFLSGLDARLSPGVRSWGRFPDGGADELALAAPSPGAANTVELEGRVVINEIHYHPAKDPSDPEAQTRREFIELHNRGTESVSLSGWRFTRGLDHAFADGASIPAGGFLVVAGDPAAVRALHGLPAEAVVGGFASRLANDTETVRLEDARGNPADEVRYADDGSWPPQADGGGSSLELVHPALANDTGLSFRAGPPGGTPFAPNAALSATPPPVVFAVRHEPVVPRRGQPILVTARASAVDGVRRLRLSWTVEHGTGAGEAEMRDDGLSGDGLAGDGLWGGIIPPPVPADQRPPRVVFAIAVEDERGQSVSYPGTGRSFLLEVEDPAPTGNENPRYRLVMTDASWNQLRTRGSGSDVLLDTTFIGDGEVFYGAGIRYRGNGARNPPDGRFSYRVQLTDERRFRGIRKINLNSQRVGHQALGNDLVRRAGLAAPQFWPANLWIDGALDRGYLRVESIDADFIDRNFPAAESGGNLYRANRGAGGRQGDLRWYGADAADYRDIYVKVSNEDDADWSDVIALSNLLVNTADADFPAAARAAIDVEEWCRYFAVYAALGSSETGLYRDDGDDYFLYRRPSDGRWLLFPWDHDSDFTPAEATQILFRPSSPPVRRLLTHPDFAPIYHCIVEELMDGAFSRPEMEARYPLVADLGGPGTIAAIDGYVTARLSFLGSRIPRELTAGATGTGGAGGELVRSGDAFRYLEGLDDPPADWTFLGFDDGGWNTGPTPIGAVYDPLGTEVQPVLRYLVVYARRRFQVDDPSSISALELRMAYDDGFAAWLNGNEVARANLGASGRPVPSDTRAASGHDAFPRETFPIPPGALLPGENVLAVAVANNRLTSGDLLLDPVLAATGARSSAPGGGCGDLLSAADPSVVLQGRAPACGTRSVKVNGVAATWFPVETRWRAAVALAPGANAVTVEAFDGEGELLERRELVVDRGDGFRAVQGTLAASEVWTKAEGPYHVAATLEVPVGLRLEIGAGTSVLFAADASLNVRGELSIAGDEASPVLLQPIDCSSTWIGLRLLDTGAAEGSPVHRIRGAAIRGAAGAAIEARAARVEVSETELLGPGGPAVLARDSVVSLDDCRIREAVVRSTASRLVMRRTRVEGPLATGPAVLLDGDGPGGSHLEEVDVSSPLDAGVSLAGGASPAIVASRLHDCARAALAISGGTPRVSTCLLVRSGTGLLLQGGTLSAEHLTITENGVGLDASATAAGRVASSILWGNGHDVRLPATGVEVAWSLTGGEEAPPGAGNIAGDPLFASFESYELAPGSPALGAGEGGSDMGAVASPDLGPRFVRGDYSPDAALDLADAIAILSYLFLGAEPSPCEDAGDVDDTGVIDLSDAITLLGYLFLGGPPPPPPFPGAGRDPTADGLGCRS